MIPVTFETLDWVCRERDLSPTILRAVADAFNVPPDDPNPLAALRQMRKALRQGKKLDSVPDSPSGSGEDDTGPHDDDSGTGTLSDVALRMRLFPGMEDEDPCEVYAAELYAVDGIGSVRAFRFAGLVPDRKRSPLARMTDILARPAVSAYIAERKAERSRTTGVTLDNALFRLSVLSRKAEDMGQITAAITAEKTRAAMAGLSVDNRKTVTEDVGKDQLIQSLEVLLKENPNLTFALAKVVPGLVIDMKGTDPDSAKAPGRALLEGLKDQPLRSLMSKGLPEAGDP
jgi:hypothetical protein